MPKEREAGPQDGDPFEEDLPEEENPDYEVEEEDEGELEAPDPKDEKIADLEAKLARLEKQIPPPKPAEPEPEEEVDYSELMFTDPNEALRLHGEQVEKRVKRELKREYEQDQGTRQFWNQFFEKYPDLKNDRDLVEATLSGNLSELADLPVDQAIDRLGRLTRSRIARYRNKGGRKKAAAEGSGSPSPKAKKPEKDNVTTLSDIIRNRRNKRRGAAA